MHLDLSELYAYRDAELPAPQQAACEQHLAACAACRAQLAALRQQGAALQAHLTVLEPATVPPPAPTWAALQTRIQTHASKERWTMLKNLFAKRSVWVGAALVATLALAFSFPPVQAWAGQFLGLFRVQQITVLPLDTTRFSQISSSRTLGDQMGEMFADTVKITREPAEPQEAADVAAAAKLAGFAVRAPAVTPAQISVQSGGAFEVVIDREQAQGLLNEMGRTDLQLPASVDGATISIDIPTSVVMAFGICPTAEDAKAVAAEHDPDNQHWRTYPDCVMFAQMPSPTVNTPPDLDMVALAELGLQVLGLTPEEARTFSANVDWATTLVVPLPTDMGEYQTVTVDGVSGTLLYPYADLSIEQNYTLLWVNQGQIYALNGHGLPLEAMTWANELK